MIDLSLEHIGLAARDTVSLKEWYTRALGARVLYANELNPPAFFLALPGGALIEIYPATETVPARENGAQGWRHLALRTRALETTMAALRAHGVEVADPKPAGGGGRVAFFRDPEGNLLHLIERPSDTLFPSA